VGKPMQFQKLMLKKGLLFYFWAGLTIIRLEVEDEKGNFSNRFGRAVFGEGR